MRNRLLLSLIGGISALVVAMGVGRFAYTPILPLMARQVGLSEALAGYLAAGNYLGYLIGAVAAGLAQERGDRQRLLRLGLIVSLLTTGSMGWLTGLPIWLGLRFLGGLASATIFVAASSLLLDDLAQQGRRSWAGILYGGVGLGIVLTGLAVPPLGQMGGWRLAWIGLALLSIPLAALTWLTLGKGGVPESPLPSGSPAAQPEGRAETGTAPILPWLMAAYGFEGLGYIVTGTFLVSMVEQMLGQPAIAAASWVLVGLAAMPSSFLWTLVGARWGLLRTLPLIFAVQAVGVALPALQPTPTSAILGAVLFGATFMGITSLTLSLARQLRPDQSAGVIGQLTAVYGLGQIIGPAGAGLITATTGSYRLPLLLAAAAITAGAALLAAGAASAKAALSAADAASAGSALLTADTASARAALLTADTVSAGAPLPPAGDLQKEERTDAVREHQDHP